MISDWMYKFEIKYADYGYIIENGRVVLKGEAKAMSENKEVQELYMGTSDEGRVSFRDVKFYHRRRAAFA